MLHRPPEKNAADVRNRQCTSHVLGQEQKPFQIFLAERNMTEDIEFFKIFRMAGEMGFRDPQGGFAMKVILVRPESKFFSPGNFAADITSTTSMKLVTRQ